MDCHAVWPILWAGPPAYSSYKKAFSFQNNSERYSFSQSQITRTGTALGRHGGNNIWRPVKVELVGALSLSCLSFAATEMCSNPSHSQKALYWTFSKKWLRNISPCLFCINDCSVWHLTDTSSSFVASQVISLCLLPQLQFCLKWWKYNDAATCMSKVAFSFFCIGLLYNGLLEEVVRGKWPPLDLVFEWIYVG